MKFTYKIRDGKRLLEIGDIVADSERDAIMDVLRKDDLSFEPKDDQRYVIEVGDTVAGAFGDEFAEVATVASYTSDDVVEYTDGFMYVPETEGEEYPDCQYIYEPSKVPRLKNWSMGPITVHDMTVRPRDDDDFTEHDDDFKDWLDRFVLPDLTTAKPVVVDDVAPISMEPTIKADLEWEEIRRSVVRSGYTAPLHRPSLTVKESESLIVFRSPDRLEMLAPVAMSALPTEFLLNDDDGSYSCWTVAEFRIDVNGTRKIFAKRWGS